MITPVYSINYNLGLNYPSFQAKVSNKPFNSELQFCKRIFNYAPDNSKPVEIYCGPKSVNAGFSTENLEDIGGGYLVGNMEIPLSTTGVRTCAFLNLLNSKTQESILWHVYDRTGIYKIEQFIRKFMPEFDTINIVGGDHYKTVNTMKDISKACDIVNPKAKKIFYYTVTENPELVAYKGNVYYMDGKMGTASFVQKDNYYY